MELSESQQAHEDEKWRRRYARAYQTLKKKEAKPKHRRRRTARCRSNETYRMTIDEVREFIH